MWSFAEQNYPTLAQRIAAHFINIVKVIIVLGW